MQITPPPAPGPVAEYRRGGRVGGAGPLSAGRRAQSLRPARPAPGEGQTGRALAGEAGYRLRNRFESLLSKMFVETEGGSHAKFPHGLKAHAIHQAKLFSPSRQQRTRRGAVTAFGNPIDSQGGGAGTFACELHFLTATQGASSWHAVGRRSLTVAALSGSMVYARILATGGSLAESPTISRTNRADARRCRRLPALWRRRWCPGRDSDKDRPRPDGRRAPPRPRPAGSWCTAGSWG